MFVEIQPDSTNIKNDPRIRQIIIILGRRQAEMSILSMNVDKKIVRSRVFDFHPTGDKWQSKTLFLAIFDLRSSIVLSVFDCGLHGVIIVYQINLQTATIFA